MWCGCFEPVAEAWARWLSESRAAIDRRQAIGGIAATLSLAVTGCAPAATPAQKTAGAALVEETLSIDLQAIQEWCARSRGQPWTGTSSV